LFSKLFIHYQIPGNWYEPICRSPVLLPLCSARYTFNHSSFFLSLINTFTLLFVKLLVIILPFFSLINPFTLLFVELLVIFLPFYSLINPFTLLFVELLVIFLPFFSLINPFTLLFVELFLMLQKEKVNKYSI
jgi:hypothetical protein